MFIKKLMSVLFISSLMVSTCFATSLTIPNVYSVNGQVTSTNLNGNFQAVAAKINGGLDNANADSASGYRFFETRSSLPVAGSQGRVIFLTSDNSLNFDTGSAWNKVPTGGVLMPSGSVFFMATGSCPSGTTDVSTTYLNKFVKINPTAGTSIGAVLTGATDSHVLTTAQMPVHGGHVSQNADHDAGSAYTTAAGTGVNAGGGSGHTHDLSTATTLAPSSISMKACSVD